MRRLFAAIVFALSLSPAFAQDDRFERLGVYVVASDVGKSVAFYEKLLDKAPAHRTPVFVGFDVAGGLFAVVSKVTFAPNVVRGDNAVPYLKVKDIRAMFDHVKKVAPDALLTPDIVGEPPLQLFKVKDPDGNVVEFYALTKPAAKP